MQDNLEFLQWVKKYWDQHYPGGDYDAVGRRKASGAPATAAAAAPRAASSGSRRGVTPTTAASRGPRVAAAAIGGGGAATAALQQEIATQKEAIAGLEKERDFYFAKLRDIELLLQNAIEENPELENEEDTLVKHIQGILYSTEVSLFAFWCVAITGKCVALISLFFRTVSKSPLRMRWQVRPMIWRRSDQNAIRSGREKRVLII
jgi:RP/EB family microtubule-associated protein